MTPAEYRHAQRQGFLSPVTTLGILRRLQAMRRDWVCRIIAARKSGQPVFRTMDATLKPLPTGRLVLDESPRLTEALAKFGGAA